MRLSLTLFRPLATPQMRGDPGGHRLDVQGLRTVAILAVLLFHVYPDFFPNGYLGVDMFFVISGYLIFTIFSRSLRKGGKFHEVAATFYYRRFARIIPLSALYMCIAVVVLSVLLYPEMIPDAQEAAWQALLFTTNIVSMYRETDYFVRVYDDNPFTHIWSLSAEIQFYLLVPLLFLLRRSLPEALGRRFFPIVVTVSVVYHVVSSSMVAFNSPFARLWQFLVIALFEHRVLPEDPGQFAMRLHDVKYHQLGSEDVEKDREVAAPTFSRDRSRSSLIICLLSMVTLGVAYAPLLVAPFLGRVLVTLATALLIAFGDDVENPLLTNSPAVFIGDASYSLYLIHWPFTIYLARGTTAMSCERENTILLSLATTIIVYYAYEKHYRHWSKKVCVTVMVILYALAALLILSSPALNAHFHRQEGGAISREQAIKANEHAFKHQQQNLIINECRYENWRNLTKQEHKAHIQKPFATCYMPPGKGKLNVLVLGNSYAPNQSRLVWKHFQPFFANFTVFSQQSCEVFTHTISQHCAWYANYTDVLDFLKPDVVFVIQRYGIAKDPLPPAGKADVVYEEMERHLDAIVDKAKLWFVMNSFPAINYDALWKMNSMIRKGDSADAINNAIVLLAEDPPARARVDKLMKHCGKRCHLYDVEPGLLDNGRFAAYDGSTSLALFDPSAHLTPHGRKRVEPYYRMLAKKYGPELVALGDKLHPRR